MRTLSFPRPLRSILVPFQQLKLRIAAGTEERVALHSMSVRPPAAAAAAAGGAAVAAPPSATEAAQAAEAEGMSLQVELGALGGTMRRLKALLSAVLGYVDEVVVSGLRVASPASALPP